MKVVIFGASGMVGQSVLRECLQDSSVESVLLVGRRTIEESHAKVESVVHSDFLDFSALEKNFRGIDACFYCLGVASGGLSESQYREITCDFTIAAAKSLLRANPKVTFVFISGTGADSTEQGRIMWARIKGKTENELFKMPFERVIALRPALIRPRNGIQSRTRLYRWLYFVLRPIIPLVQLAAPSSVISTDELGKVMLHIARHGHKKKVLESPDLVAVAALINN